jgi:hypothetical protein
MSAHRRLRGIIYGLSFTRSFPKAPGEPTGQPGAAAFIATCCLVKALSVRQWDPALLEAVLWYLFAVSGANLTLAILGPPAASG